MSFGKRDGTEVFAFLETRSSPPTAAQTLLTLQMLLVLLPAREKTQDAGEPSPKNNPPKEPADPPPALQQVRAAKGEQARLEIEPWPPQQARSPPQLPHQSQR